jgi:hypothetical protein
VLGYFDHLAYPHVYLRRILRLTSVSIILQENLERFTHILVDSAFTKHQDSIPIHVLFVATRTGIIKKLSYNPRSRVTCLVEILHPFAEGRPVLIHNMKLLGKPTLWLQSFQIESLQQILASHYFWFCKNVALCKILVVESVNPIPTGHGWNQPIYECHMTTAGRNRVKFIELAC